jgi:hypothetical protein
MARCKGITLTGRRCKKTCNNSEFCFIHNKICCGICLEEDVRSNQATKLDCGHTFCSNCINKWICVTKNSSCPNCRDSISLIHKNNAIKWGIYNNVIIPGYKLTIDLSSFDEESQNYFIDKTGVVKNKLFNLTNISDFLLNIEPDSILSNMWVYMMYTTEKHNVYIINNIEEKTENPFYVIFI